MNHGQHPTDKEPMDDYTEPIQHTWAAATVIVDRITQGSTYRVRQVKVTPGRVELAVDVGDQG